MKLRNTLLSSAIALALAAPAFAAVTKPVEKRTADPTKVAAVRAASARKPETKPAAEPTSVKLPELAAERIVEKNIAARGGLDAWRRVQAMSMTGKLDAGKRRVDGGHIGTQTSTLAKSAAKAEFKKAMFAKPAVETDNIIQLPFKMEMQRPRLSRFEIEFQGSTAVQVYDGTNGWKLRPFLGRQEVEAFTPDEMKAASQQQDLDGPLIDYAAKGTKVALAGTERVDGHDTYKLALTLKGGEVRNLWIDAKSFLEVQMEGAPRRMDGKLRTVLTLFRDYKPVDGLIIPHSIETRVEGMREGHRILVAQVALNPALDGSHFAKPQ